MWRRIRVLMCCLAALLLPLQSVAHDAMRACGDRHAPVTAPTASADGVHLAHRHADAAHAAHAFHAPHASHGSHAGAVDAAPIADDGAAAPGPSSGAACALCAACGVASALPATGAGLAPVLSAGQEWSQSPAARVARVPARGLERPPRALDA